MVCEECGATFYKSTEPITDECRGEIVTVSGIEHYHCPRCGNYAVSFSHLNELSRAFREAARRKKEEREAAERAAAERGEALIA